MNLHLVFHTAILGPLATSLRNRDYIVAGTDVTLEQCYIAADAGRLQADIAILDAAAGAANKRESISLLQKIRMSIPQTRLIVILPEPDLDWQKALGMYGIYDVYVTETFDIEDIVSWIETQKTIADIPKLDVTTPSSKRDSRLTRQSSFQEEGRERLSALPSWLRRKSKAAASTEMAEQNEQVLNTEAEEDPAEQAIEEIIHVPMPVEETSSQVEEELEPDGGSHEEVWIDEVPTVDTREKTSPSQEHVAVAAPIGTRQTTQTIIIAVGALVGRSGTTHTAIQAAYEASRTHKTALVEIAEPQKHSDLRYLVPTSEKKIPIRVQKIDIFPESDEQKLLEISTSGDYEMIVIDLGVLIMRENGAIKMKSAAHWLMRSEIPILAFPASPWDMARWIPLLHDSQLLLKRAHSVLNYANPEEAALCTTFLKESCASVIHNVLSHPFNEAGQLLQDKFIPKPRKKFWF